MGLFNKSNVRVLRNEVYPDNKTPNGGEILKPKKSFKFNFTYLIIGLVYLIFLIWSFTINATSLYIIDCFIALILIGVLYFLWWKKKRDNLEKQSLSDASVPEDLLTIFNECESELKNHPDKKPFEILWEVTKRHHDYSKLLKGGENDTGESKSNSDDRCRGVTDVSGLEPSTGQELQSLGDKRIPKNKKYVKPVD